MAAIDEPAHGWVEEPWSYSAAGAADFPQSPSRLALTTNASAADRGDRSSSSPFNDYAGEFLEGSFSDEDDFGQRGAARNGGQEGERAGRRIFRRAGEGSSAWASLVSLGRRMMQRQDRGGGGGRGSGTGGNDEPRVDSSGVSGNGGRNNSSGSSGSSGRDVVSHVLRGFESVTEQTLPSAAGASAASSLLQPLLAPPAPSSSSSSLLPPPASSSSPSSSKPPFTLWGVSGNPSRDDRLGSTADSSTSNSSPARQNEHVGTGRDLEDTSNKGDGEGRRGESTGAWSRGSSVAGEGRKGISSLMEEQGKQARGKSGFAGLWSAAVGANVAAPDQRPARPSFLETAGSVVPLRRSPNRAEGENEEEDEAEVERAREEMQRIGRPLRARWHGGRGAGGGGGGGVIGREGVVVGSEGVRHACWQKTMEVVPVLAVVCLLALGTVLYFTVLDRVLPQLKPRFCLACHTEEGEWVKQPKTATATSTFAESAAAKPPPFTYSAASCRHIRDDFNCVKYGLSLSEEDEAAWQWRWEPDQCRLPSLTAKEFLKVMAHRRIAFVGDKTVANQFDSLVCLLAQEEEPVEHTEAETPPSAAEAASAGKAVGSTDEQKATGRLSADETGGLNANTGGSSSMGARTAASAAGNAAAGKLVGPSSGPPSHVRSSPWWDMWPSSRAKGKRGKKERAAVAGGEDEEPVVVTPGDDDDMEGGARRGKKAGAGGSDRSVVVYPSYNVTVAFFHSRFLVEARADVEVNGTACQLTKAVAANQVQQEALPDAAVVVAGGSSSGGGVDKGAGSGRTEAATAAAAAAASAAVAAADAASRGNGSGGSLLPSDAGRTRFGRKAMARHDDTPSRPGASPSSSLPGRSKSSNPRSSSAPPTVVPAVSASTLLPTTSELSMRPSESTNEKRASGAAPGPESSPAPSPNVVPEPGPPPEPAPDPVAAVCYPNHIDVARPDPLWAAEVSRFDVLVLSSGRAWTEESVEREGLAIVEDGRREKGMSVEGLVGEWAFPRAMSAVAQWLENDTNFRGVAVFRTFSPSHGRRECAARTLLSLEEARDSQVTDAFQRFNRAMEDALSHTRHLLLNVSLMSAQRADGHPWMASPLRPKADCSHWCLPGVPDTWNRILAAMLVDIFREKSRFQEPKLVR